MRQYIYITLLFILSSNFAFGHSDFWVAKDFGNVKVRVKTGFQYEEIEKCWIIGVLASKLCKELKYTKTVFIDFEHFYILDCDPDYFLSFDNGTIIFDAYSEKPKAFLKENSLIIRQVSRQFTASVTLRLLEYAIHNAHKIESTQKVLEYKQNYCNWKIKTIDTLLVKKIATGNISDIVSKVLSKKIYRQKAKEDPYNVSYYFQNNKYYIFYNDHRAHDSVLLMVDNIYQFETVSFEKSIIFDTDSTFYFVQGVNNPHSSKRNIIKNIYDNYQPFEVAAVGSHLVAFSFWNYDRTGGTLGKERSVVYNSNTNQLVQDLDKKLTGN